MSQQKKAMQDLEKKLGRKPTRQEKEAATGVGETMKAMRQGQTTHDGKKIAGTNASGSKSDKNRMAETKKKGIIRKKGK